MGYTGANCSRRVCVHGGRGRRRLRGFMPGRRQLYQLHAATWSSAIYVHYCSAIVAYGPQRFGFGKRAKTRRRIAGNVRPALTPGSDFSGCFLCLPRIQFSNASRTRALLRTTVVLTGRDGTQPGPRPTGVRNKTDKVIARINHIDFPTRVRPCRHP